MNDQIFRDALIEAKEFFDKLKEEEDQIELRRAEIKHEIAVLRAKIISLVDLIDERPDEQPGVILDFIDDVRSIGLTQAIREILMVSGERPMSAMNVREGLNKLGFDLTEYSNVQATINTILARLHSSGEVDVSAPQQGEKKMYIWSPLHPLQIRLKAKELKAKTGKAKTGKRRSNIGVMTRAK